MGLRCLLGHDFDAPETERERDEQGNEVVATVREVKVCRRCGERQIVSENKEVTSLEAAFAPTAEESSNADAQHGGAPRNRGATSDRGTSAAGAEPPADVQTGVAPANRDSGGASDGPATAGGGTSTDGPTPADEPGAGDPAAADADATADPATSSASGDGPTDGRGEDGASAAEDPSDDEFEPPASAAEDDGVILDDEDDDPERERAPGEWPDASDVRAGDEGDRTDGTADGETVEDDFGGTDALPADRDGGVILNDDLGERAGATAENGTDSVGATEVPGVDPTSGEKGYDAEFVPNDGESTLAGAEAPDGPLKEGDWSEGAPGAAVDVEEQVPTAVEYHCPECGHTRPVGDSSMRAGDICPECHTGYIEERER